MTKLIDPDNLNQGTEIDILSGSKTIQLNEAGNLSTDGVTGQCVYSFLKEEWKDDPNLIKFPFPMVSITEEKFDLIEGWDWADQATKNLIRDAGWSKRDASNNSQEEFACIITLGSFVDSVNDGAYYQQGSRLLPTNFELSGPVNQAVKIFGDGTHGNVDFRQFLKIFLREQAKTYADADIVDQNIVTLDYKVYKFPLENDNDLKVTTSDADIETLAPYTGMSFTYITGSGFGPWQNSTVYVSHSVVEDGGSWYQTTDGGTSSGTGVGDDVGVTWVSYTGERTIGSTNVAFNVIADGNNGTKEEIYEFGQYELRQIEDIDAGTDFTSITGSTADVLMNFVGDQLVTTDGVYIDNFATSDTNAITFTDVSGSTFEFPFVAAGTINFNANLQNDSDARYWMFFDSVPSGDLGTQNAVIVEDNNGFPITGAVNGSASISFDFDYDNNAQGGRTPATDASVTVIAIGLETGQYATAEGTINRSNSNTFSVVAALERNYNNQ